jgi:ribosomal protein S18 acetylase RimI-like enzyme
MKPANKRPKARPARIRPARLSDVPELMAMMRALNASDLIPWRPTRVLPALRGLLRDARVGAILVSEMAGARRLGGYAVGTFGYDLEFAGPDAFVTELFVRPEVRRAGEGRRLLEALAARMRRGGAAALHLVVRPENTAARRLYAGAGFARVERLLLSKRL